MSTAKIQVKVFTVQRHGCWIAYCPALKLYGFSQSGETAALDDFDRAIDTFVSVQSETGKLDETLKTLGWEKHDRQLAAPNRRYESSVSPFRNEELHFTHRQIAIPA